MKHNKLGSFDKEGRFHQMDYGLCKLQRQVEQVAFPSQFHLSLGVDIWRCSTHFFTVPELLCCWNQQGSIPSQLSSCAPGDAQEQATEWSLPLCNLKRFWAWFQAKPDVPCSHLGLWTLFGKRMHCKMQWNYVNTSKYKLIFCSFPVFSLTLRCL